MNCYTCPILKRVRQGVPRSKARTRFCPYCSKVYKHKPSHDRHVEKCRHDIKFKIAQSVREVEKLIAFKGGFNGPQA